MKRNLLLILILLLTLKSFSQDSKFSVELNYPLPVGDNFISENYHGVIEAGFKYYAYTVSPVKLGASLNSAYVKDSEGDPMNPFL